MDAAFEWMHRSVGSSVQMDKVRRGKSCSIEMDIVSLATAPLFDVAAEVWAGLPGRQSLRSAWFVGQQRARGNNGIGWMHAVVPGSRLFSSGLWLRRAEGAR